MGMHIGLVAARCHVTELRDAFFHAWPNYAVIELADALPNAESLWSWKESNEKFVSAADWSKDNPGREVFLFWQDGPWAVMMDPSYTLATSQSGLASLSARIGEVLAFVVESSGGYAEFMSFAAGALRRRICNSDGDLTTEGQPLPEESGVDVSAFYMDETEAMLRAFGLSEFEKMPSDIGCQAICVTDRTDYSTDEMKSPFDKPPTIKKPWWRFW